MDQSRYKQRALTTRRHLTDVNFGISDISPKVVLRAVESTPSLVKPKLRKRLVSDISPRPVRKPQVITEVGQVEALLNVSTTQPVAKAVNSPLDMGLPGNLAGSKSGRTVVTAKRASKLRRLLLRGLLIVVVLAAIAGGVLVSQGYIKIHKAFKGSAVSVPALTANVAPTLLKGEGAGRINVLLLGRGGGTHDAPDLTDTMILASVDPVNDTATLISIPRDLWVNVPKQSSMKINAAWETGEFRNLGKVTPGSTDPAAIQAGFNEVDQVVTAVFGVPINYNVIVDFQAFKQAVDTVGGITVNVPENLYDPTMAWENKENNYSSILAKAGVQTFDGTQALIYVRSRETTTDFARSLRQRTVMLALKTKIDTLGTLSNPIKIAGLINAFGNNVASDLSISDATRLYGIVKNIADSSINSIGLADPPNHFITTSSIQVPGQSIDLPSAGLFDYSAIQSYIKTQLKDGYIIKENAKILILNGTTTPGIATTVTSELAMYGYNVVATANAPTSGYAQTTVVDLSSGRDKYTANYLEQRFNVKAVSKLPDQSIQTNGADFVIIIGSNELTTPKI